MQIPNEYVSTVEDVADQVSNVIKNILNSNTVYIILYFGVYQPCHVTELNLHTGF